MQIQINDKTFDLPTLKTLMLGDYQEIQNLIASKKDSLTTNAKILEILGIDQKTSLALPLHQFNELVDFAFKVFEEQPKDTNEIGHITIKKKSFEFRKEFLNISTAEFIDIDTLLSGDTANNLHLVLAILFRPKGRKKDYDASLIEARGSLFQKHLDMETVFQCLGFFLTFANIFSHLTQEYLANLSKPKK